MGSSGYPKLFQNNKAVVTLASNLAQLTFVKFVSRFTDKFTLYCRLAKVVNIVLLICTVIAYLFLQYAGEVYHTLDMVLWGLLFASLLFYALCYHLYKKHTKQLTQRLFDEQMDIEKYNLRFLEKQHELTIVNTLEYNLYLANFLVVTFILSGIQFGLTIGAIAEWSSTTNYVIAYISGALSFIAMGFPFAYNILTKLSHIYLFRTNETDLKLIGKPIAFTCVGEFKPNIIAPRYYQIIQETISTSRHANYVVQLIKVIDYSANKYEYSVIKIDYLSEIKNHILSETDYQSVVSALRKNGFVIQ